MSVSKGIGFNRNIKLDWLEATASLSLETDDPTEIRKQLKPILAEDRTGKDAIRKSIDILINIWIKSATVSPILHQEAIQIYENSDNHIDRLSLHYGLTMLYFPFFFQCVSAIGQLSRYGDPITNKSVIKQMASEIGHLGSLERSTQRVVASLRDWGILVYGDKRFTYEAKRYSFLVSQPRLQAWQLACLLTCNPAEEILFADLLRQPALFPFAFTLSLEDLRQVSWFEIQRQGMGLNMVCLSEAMTNAKATL